MVTRSEAAAQLAPARLERVRTLLNSWLIPNDTRAPTDRFSELAHKQRWRPTESARVRELRDDLRRALETGDVFLVNTWIDRVALRPAVENGEIVYWHRRGPAGQMVAAVVTAIGDGTWKRMKVCPDCHWVFYDNTRNGSKRWCLMYAGGPDGRACGTIAKVRRYRDRHSAAGTAQ